MPLWIIKYIISQSNILNLLNKLNFTNFQAQNTWNLTSVNPKIRIWCLKKVFFSDSIWLVKRLYSLHLKSKLALIFISYIPFNFPLITLSISILCRTEDRCDGQRQQTIQPWKLLYLFSSSSTFFTNGQTNRGDVCLLY